MKRLTYFGLTLLAALSLSVSLASAENSRSAVGGEILESIIGKSDDAAARKGARRSDEIASAPAARQVEPSAPPSAPRSYSPKAPVKPFTEGADALTPRNIEEADRLIAEGRGPLFSGFSSVNANKSFDAPDWSGVSPRTGADAKTHVQLEHGNLRPGKPIQGVFYGDPVLVTNDAWRIGRQLDIKPTTVSDRDYYVIPRRNSGYSGGDNAQRTNFDYVTIVTQKDTSQIVTSFPSGRTHFNPNESDWIK